jgi:hypothetical protein
VGERQTQRAKRCSDCSKSGMSFMFLFTTTFVCLFVCLVGWFF